jgi:DNA-binding transcriptional ArsR family regulator
LRHVEDVKRIRYVSTPRPKPSPIRDAILDAMRKYGKPISPVQLDRVLPAYTLGSIAYHVRVLRSAGIIEGAEEGRVRGAVEHFYVLSDDLATPDIRSDLRDLQRLCGVLTLPNEEGLPCHVELDEPALREMQDLLDTLRPRVEAVVRKAAQRVPAVENSDPVLTRRPPSHRSPRRR